MPLMLEGGGNFSMTSIFTWSTYNPTLEIMCSKTISSLTMKWHFSHLTLNFSLYILLAPTPSCPSIFEMILQKLKNHPKHFNGAFYEIGEDDHHASL